MDGVTLQRPYGQTLGNRALIESALPQSVIPGKAGIRNSIAARLPFGINGLWISAFAEMTG